VTAATFAANGYHVAVSDINEEAAGTTVEQIRAAGGKADYFVADIGSPAAVVEMFAAIKARLGRVDAAFNNAGIGLGDSRGPLADTDDDVWENCLRINLSGTFYCMKQELRMMLEQGGGAIVNNCSILGLGGGISSPYTATKHGIAGLTKSAALGYGKKNIRVNAVCPGLIDAGMGARLISHKTPSAQAVLALQPIARAGTAEEVANAVLWLCSDSASYVTGHMLPIDGGYVSL
jgi:NAD(P)-dependent dehydrogenase (short-subunit alcohol dehydrogenase family)